MMTIPKHLLLVISLFLCSFSVSARGSSPLGNLIPLNNEDGISSSTVYHAYQDRQGFMWFGTEYGVYKYDGYSFEHFSELRGVPDNAIIRIKEDEDGRIWFFPTNGKPSFYYRGQVFSEENLEILKVFTARKHIWDIARDRHGNWWFSINNSPIVKISPNGKVEEFSLWEYGHSMGSPFRFYEREDGMWIFGSLGLFPIGHPEVEPIYTPSSVGNLYARYFRRENGDLLISTYDNRIAIWKDESFELYSSITLPSQILCLMEDSSGELWVGTRDGMFRGFPDHAEQFLPGTSVTSILEDREGNIWFTSLDQGIMFIPGFKVFMADDKRLEGKVQLIESDAQRVWIGFEDNRLVELSGGGITEYDFSSQYGGTTKLRDLVPLDSSSFLVGYEHQLYLVNEGENYIPPFYFGLKHCARDDDGGIYAMFPYRLVYFSKEDIESWATDDLSHIRNDTTLSRKYYTHRTISAFRGSLIHRLDSTKYLLAALDGLNILEDDSLMKVPPGISPVKVRTRGVLPTRDGFWIATLGQGAFLWEGNGWFQLDQRNGLLDPYCTSIFEDGNENIWIGTPRGLHFIPKGYRTPMRYFTVENGLPANEITGIGQLGDSLWIGTSKGLCRVDLNNLDAFLDPPQVSLSALFRNGQALNPLSPPPFSEEDHLEIRVAAISFRHQGKILFRYQLLDEQGTVVDSGKTYEGNLSFHGLGSGTYDLDVQASNGGQVWGKPIRLLSFEVETPIQVPRGWLALMVASVLLGLGILFWWSEKRKAEKVEQIDHWVNLKVDGKVRRIRSMDIYFVKASGDFVEVYLEKEKILFRSTMKNMESLLEEASFIIRIHRSYLVNISKVNSYNAKELDLPGHKLPLSKSYRSRVLPILEKHGHSS